MSGPPSSLVLRAEPASAALARRFLKHALADTPKEVREIAVLGVSELVANVVLHTDCEALTVIVDRDGPGVRVEVHDDNPGAVVYREAGTDAEEGHGLQIINALASRWGVSRADGSGKSVWFLVEPS